MAADRQDNPGDEDLGHGQTGRRDAAMRLVLVASIQEMSHGIA